MLEAGVPRDAANVAALAADVAGGDAAGRCDELAESGLKVRGGEVLAPLAVLVVLLADGTLMLILGGNSMLILGGNSIAL